MSREQHNKAIVGRWFEGFWGNPLNPEIIDELAAADMLLQYSLHAPRRGRADVRNFMEGFRAAFPDLNFYRIPETEPDTSIVCPRCGAVGWYEQVVKQGAGLINGLLTQEQCAEIIKELSVAPRGP